MVKVCRYASGTIWILLSADGYAANPFPDAIKRISALQKPPEFEPGEIYEITSGSFDHEDRLWKTTIKLKGDFCIYEASHPSSHFKKVVWKKGVGLLEYASGYGAHADGYRLKRVAIR
jgi:hypothetical protein